MTGRWVGIVALLACAACDREVTLLSTRKAPWSYVEDGWGGIAVAAATTAEDRVSLTLRLRVHATMRTDSGICTCGTRARVKGERILVRVNKCICGPGAGSPLVAKFPRPKAGDYAVVYDDRAAGFPQIGRLRVR